MAPPLHCKIWSLPFLSHALHSAAIQGKEGIKFCHLATLGPCWMDYRQTNMHWETWLKHSKARAHSTTFSLYSLPDAMTMRLSRNFCTSNFSSPHLLHKDVTQKVCCLASFLAEGASSRNLFSCCKKDEGRDLKPKELFHVLKILLSHISFNENMSMVI